MRNRKIKKQLWKSLLLLFGVAFIIYSCEKETDLFENESFYETASKKEIISFLEVKESAKGITPYVTFNINDAKLEDIKNTNAKLTVVPAKTKRKNLYSRVLFLKVNDTVKGVVFNMYSNIKNKKGKFSGEITVNKLNGDLIKAFRVNNGHLNSVYNNYLISKSSSNYQNKLLGNKTSDDDGAECREVCKHSADDPDCLCNMQWLDEIVIMTPSELPVEGFYEIDLFYFFNSLYGGDPQTTDPNLWVYTDNAGGSSGGGSDNSWSTDTILFTNVSDPIVLDIPKYLECFDLNASATITIYVDQPIANSDATYFGTNVGHTFISITQNSITRTLGYYPIANTIRPISYFNNPQVLSAPAVIRNNELHEYDVSISTNIDARQLNSVINIITNYNSTYHLNTFNCTDFGILVGNNVGIGLPDTSGSWPGNGSGSNPGNLGQDIRGMNANSSNIINISGGRAPRNSGTCN